MQLVLNTYGLQLSQRNHCFQIEAKTGNRIISPARITSILVTKNINITSSAILLVAEHNIPIVLMDNTGHPLVKINALLSPGLTLLRKKQLDLSKTSESLSIIKELLVQKVQGQLANIAWWINRHNSISEVGKASRQKMIDTNKKMDDEWKNVKSNVRQASDSLRSWEAYIARYYWLVVTDLINKNGWKMKGRSYHPAEDEFNAALNYLYGMLYNQVETALTCAGLDSQIGLWHRDNYQTPSLSFDIIEPLRPRIDKLLTDLVLEGKLNPGNFESNEKYGFLVDKKGREILITNFNTLLEEKVKINGTVTEFKNHILQTGYYIRNVIQSSAHYEQ